MRPIKRSRTRCLLAAALCLAPADMAVANERDEVSVVLSSGQVVRGTIIEATDEFVLVDRGGPGGLLYEPFRKIPRDRIRTIEPGRAEPLRKPRGPVERFHVTFGPGWIRGSDSVRVRWGAGWHVGLRTRLLSRPDFGLAVLLELDHARLDSDVRDLTPFRVTLTGTHVRYTLARSLLALRPSFLVGGGVASYAFDAPWFPHASASIEPYASFGLRLDARPDATVKIFAEARHHALLGVGSPGLATFSGGIGF